MYFKVFIISLLLPVFANAQKSGTVKSSYFKINGSSFTSKREVILTRFGKPDKVFRPVYECGFLSEAEQQEKFYTIQYPHFKFTGNKKRGYLLEEIQLVPALKVNITFKNRPVSNSTTIKEFESMFGVKVMESSYLLIFKDREDGLVFTFDSGRLNKIEYWSPC